MIEILPTSNTKPLTEAEALEALAVQYKAAVGPGMALLGRLGERADGLVDQLPKGLQDGLFAGTERALAVALRAADLSQRVLPGQDARLTRVVAMAMGAAGGVGGVGTALTELPLTTTLFLRSIQSAAGQQGFDPKADSVRFDCVRIFASNGPLAAGESDLAFLATRMALTGPTLQALATKVAPRLAVVFGKKIAAQALPIMGAAAGASINGVYANYYHNMSLVHFGLRRLAIETDTPVEILTVRLQDRLA
jgi:hypothetical protein